MNALDSTLFVFVCGMFNGQLQMKKHFVGFTAVILCSAAMSSCVKLATVTGSNTGGSNQSSGQYPNEPGESTSKAFMGLTEIVSSDGEAKFCNPRCDDEGRLVYYQFQQYTLRYEYYSKEIICNYYNPDGSLCSRRIYTLTNGLITYFDFPLYKDGEETYNYNYTISYDGANRVSQIRVVDSQDPETSFGNEKITLKWNSSGDMYESSSVYIRRGVEGKPYYDKLEYYSTLAELPGLSFGLDGLTCTFCAVIDPILAMEGYYGNSLPRHNLKSYTTDSHSWSWTYDSSKDGIIKVTRNFYDLKYPENNGTSSYIVKWE